MCEFHRTIDGGGTHCDGCPALLTLNLQPCASDLEIKASYRALVKRWHPDLFEGDPKARVSAEEKLRTIIAAFRQLTSPQCRDSEPETILENFTIGSTRKDVLTVQGIPTASSPDIFEYGASRVFFSGDKVVGWENAPVRFRLNVQLRPAHPVAGTLHYFGIGSTRDQVLAIQGTPTAFSFNTLEYGLSKVHFKDGMVTSWESAPPWIALKVQMQ
ncbi:MAG: J domain-containing protein [Acidobacteriaceae bacterium]